MEDLIDKEALVKSLIDIASESYRFKKVFEKILLKLDAGEQKRYLSQYSWFSKKIDDALENVEFRIINLEGQLFDVGMAAMPINLDDFSVDDILYVEQMLEPIIMNKDIVIKTGTILLGRLEN